MQPWMIYMLHSTHKRLQGRWDRTRQDSSWRREQKTELLTLGVQFVLNSTSLPADKFGQRCRQHCKTVKICFLYVKSSSNQILRPRWCICCISTTLDGHTSVWPLDWHILDRAQEHILPVCVGCYLCHLTLFLDTEADGSTVAGWKKMTRNCVAPAPLPPSLELISPSWVKSATNTWTYDKKLDKISALEKLLPRVTRICYHLTPLTQFT